MERVHIQADCREEKSGVVEALRTLQDVDVEVRQLKLGDYLLPNRVLVERKSLVDLVESLKDGRLFSQASRLAASEFRGAVILEGQGRDLIGTEMRREALLGAIVSLSLVFNLAVLRSSGPAETASVLVYAARQLQRDVDDVPMRHGRRPKRKKRIQLRLLQGLPGVGAKRAQALLDHFGSVAAVVQASQEGLQEVDGFGPVVAQSIRWAVD